MLAYIIRRILMGIPTVLGVLFILFALFFWIASPELMAKRVLGEKAKEEQIQQWIKEKGYDLPKFYNEEASGLSKITETRFANYYKRMLTFNFGRSDQDNISITQKMKNGVGPSLMLTVPIFVASLLISVFISMLIAIFRGTYVDRVALFMCVIGMSVVYFLYIIGAQYFVGKVLKWFPISGWSDNHPYYFLILPIIVGIIASLAGNIRFYRTVMVNEVNNDYIRTARAKGLGEGGILFRHLLKNAMIPILTNVVMAIPFLFMGSLLMESFFGIPGLGYLTVKAIQNNDFSTVSAVVYISSLIYVVANLFTDISYTFVDPRVKLK